MHTIIAKVYIRSAVVTAISNNPLDLVYIDCSNGKLSSSEIEAPISERLSSLNTIC